MSNRSSDPSTTVLVAGAFAAPVIAGAMQGVDGLVEGSRRRQLKRDHQKFTHAAWSFRDVMQERFGEIESLFNHRDQSAEALLRVVESAREGVKQHAGWFGAQSIAEFVDDNTCTAYSLQEEMAKFLVRPVRIMADQMRSTLGYGMAKDVANALLDAERFVVQFAYEHFDVCIAREHERSLMWARARRKFFRITAIILMPILLAIALVAWGVYAENQAQAEMRAKYEAELQALPPEFVAWLERNGYDANDEKVREKYGLEYMRWRIRNPQ